MITTAFDATKVTIERKRFSTTQGEVLVSYDGQRIEQYGDAIRLVDGQWVGHDDAFWLGVAEREAVARGMARPRILIPADSRGDLKAELDKLVRKAQRYGSPLSYSFGPVEVIETKRRRWDGKDIVMRHDVVGVLIQGSAPRVGPFQFVAKVEHMAAGNIVDIAPDAPAVDQRFRSTVSMCEHCNTKRSRNETFVVLNTDTGAQVQVGRQCLKDYMGYNDPTALAWLFRFGREIAELCGSEEGGTGGWSQPTYHAQEALALTFAAIRLWGWCSKAMAQNERQHETYATATLVGLVINPPRDLRKKGNEDLAKRHDALILEARAHLEQDHSDARTVIQWVRDGGLGDSDYGHNVRAILSGDSFAAKRAGYACSAVSGWHRHQERELRLSVERKQRANSEWVGKPGERIRNVEVTQQMARVIGSGDFADTVLAKFIDAAGNVYTWFTSRGTGLQNGAKCLLTGTVKAHKQRDGAKETQLSRCILIDA